MCTRNVVQCVAGNASLLVTGSWLWFIDLQGNFVMWKTIWSYWDFSNLFKMLKYILMDMVHRSADDGLQLHWNMQLCSEAKKIISSCCRRWIFCFVWSGNRLVVVWVLACPKILCVCVSSVGGSQWHWGAHNTTSDTQILHSAMALIYRLR